MKNINFSFRFETEPRQQTLFCREIKLHFKEEEKKDGRWKFKENFFRMKK